RLERGRPERVLAAAVAFPLHPGLGRGAGAAGAHGDAVGDHEGRVEADAELADQARIRLPVLAQRLQEPAGAGTGDAADVGHDLVAVHADAGVAHGDRARVPVPAHLDPQLGVAGQQVGVADRLEAQLVAGVRGVGYQL